MEYSAVPSSLVFRQLMDFSDAVSTSSLVMARRGCFVRAHPLALSPMKHATPSGLYHRSKANRRSSDRHFSYSCSRMLLFRTPEPKRDVGPRMIDCNVFVVCPTESARTAV